MLLYYYYYYYYYNNQLFSYLQLEFMEKTCVKRTLGNFKDSLGLSKKMSTSEFVHRLNQVIENTMDEVPIIVNHQPFPVTLSVADTG